MTSQTIAIADIPLTFGRNLLSSIGEIIGDHGLEKILQSTLSPGLTVRDLSSELEHEFEFCRIDQLLTALEDLYGDRCGQGISQRAGRSFFNLLLRDFGSQTGLTDSSFRLLPLKKKIKSGLDILAKTFNQFGDQRVQVSEADHYFWVIEQCPICQGKHSPAKVCSFWVGFIQEAMYWFSSGRQYLTEETHCIAMGDPTCRIQIGKQPIE